MPTTDALPAGPAPDLLRFTTVGSVDDGKSTLVGRLLYDSKSLFEDQVAAVTRASRRADGAPDLALVTDGLRAEREQGITIDVAYRYFATPRRSFVVADTPGHVEFTRNMVTGASTADLAVVLVDAARGVRTQSRRHAFIASLLGVPHVVVAVNKMDAVGYDEAAFDAVRREVLAFAAKLDVTSVEVIPVSALVGDNVVARSAAMPWYQGPTLLYHLETVHVAGGRNLRDFRFPVQTVLRTAEGTDGGGVRALAGTVASGAIRPGEDVLVLPAGARSTVRTVCTFDGDLAEARAGDAVALTLADDLDVGRGSLLVRPGNVPTVGTTVEAMLCWMAEAPLQPGRPYLLRHTTREVTAVVAEVVYRVDVDTLHREAVPTLALNDVGRVRVEAAAPLCTDPYRVNRETGAFILIDPHTHVTVAAGMVRSTGGQAREPARGRPASPDVVWEEGGVALADREQRQGHRAAVVWFTGRPGAGKTTVARALEHALDAAGVRTALLDGDRLRHGLSGDLGFSPADRRENVRRAGEVARLFFDSGAVVLCAFVSPQREDRDRVRALVPPGRFVEVHVDVDVATARARDPKGLYAKASRGEIADLTGVSAPYEAPVAPEVVLPTAQMSVDEAVATVQRALAAAGIVAPDVR